MNDAWTTRYQQLLQDVVNLELDRRQLQREMLGAGPSDAYDLPIENARNDLLKHVKELGPRLDIPVESGPVIQIPDGQFINQCTEYMGALLDAGVPVISDNGELLSPRQMVEWLVQSKQAETTITIEDGPFFNSAKEYVKAFLQAGCPIAIPSENGRGMRSLSPRERVQWLASKAGINLDDSRAVNKDKNERV